MHKKLLHSFAILYYFPTKCYKLATIAIQILIKPVYDFGNRVSKISGTNAKKKTYARKNGNNRREEDTQQVIQKNII